MKNDTKRGQNTVESSNRAGQDGPPHGTGLSPFTVRRQGANILVAVPAGLALPVRLVGNQSVAAALDLAREVAGELPVAVGGVPMRRVPLGGPPPVRRWGKSIRDAFARCAGLRPSPVCRQGAEVRVNVPVLLVLSVPMSGKRPLAEALEVSREIVAELEVTVGGVPVRCAPLCGSDCGGEA